MDGQQSAQPPRGDDTAHLEVRHEGHVVATAAVKSSPEPHGTAKVAVERHRDDAPDAVRSDLVDQVMDTPGVSNSDNVHVVMPLGDAATITRLHERTANLTAHAAGASSVVDAEVPAPAAEQEPGVRGSE